MGIGGGRVPLGVSGVVGLGRGRVVLGVSGVVVPWGLVGDVSCLVIGMSCRVVLHHLMSLTRVVDKSR